MGFPLQVKESNPNDDQITLKCLYANLQSIFNKKKEIEIYLKDNPKDLMCFTECFINEEYQPCEYNLDGYQCFVAMKNRGGACIYVKEHLSCYEVNPPAKTEDSCWIVMKTKNYKKRVYGCIYRSPNSDHENNDKLISNIVWAKNNFDELLLIGDFNLPSVNWNTLTSNDIYASRFLDTIDNCGLEQIISEPTRYRVNQNPSLLDLLLVCDTEIISDLVLADAFGKSDHCKIEFSVKNCFVPPKNNKHRYNFRKINEEGFLNEVNTVDWSEVFRGDFDTAYERFIETVKVAIEKSTPKFKNFEKKTAPWSNHKIARLSKKKRKLWDRYKYSKLDTDYRTYTNCLREFNCEKEIAIEKYEKQIICNKKTNKKKYYQYLSKKDKYRGNKIMLNNNNTIESDEAKCAEILNSYFSSVFTRGASDLNVDVSKIPDVAPMDDITINATEIRQEIENLDTSKATGPDEIPALILQEFSNFFVPILEIIFKRSYDEGWVPQMMKVANITPIYKAGDKKEPGNYRPVSITPIIAKLFERIIKKHIETHIADNRLISEFQHGFRKNKSTSTNLIQFTNDICNLASETKSISIIYTDLKKAFDSVPHDLLILKLRKYGITGKTIRWLMHFLTLRHQQVCVGDAVSTTSVVESGVPQGGALSGLLFSLYVNDLPEHIENASISLYADDAKLYSAISSEQSIVDMQSDIDRMARWCMEWRLSVNPSKCHLVQYNPRSTTRQFNPQYSIHGVAIQRSPVVRDLGILISEDLKFHAQIDQACKRAHAEIKRIRRSFVSRSPAFIAELFKLYVRPHLEYAVEVWNPRCRGDVIKIEKVQNIMTKLIPHGHILSPQQRNAKLGLSSYEDRRLRGD